MTQLFKLEDLENMTPDVVNETITSCINSEFHNEFLDFIESFPDHLHRTCEVGHLTGSSLMVRERSDEWGAMLSEKFGPVVHEFDCYDTRVPKHDCQRCKLKFNSVCAGASHTSSTRGADLRLNVTPS